MLKISKKAFLAVETVALIAYSTTEEGSWVQSKKIMEHQGLPPRYLEYTLQNLVRAGILSSTRGPKGGYYLSKDIASVSVLEIVKAIGQEMESADDLSKYAPIGKHVLYPICQNVLNIALEILDDITIEDLCIRSKQANIPRVNIDG